MKRRTLKKHATRQEQARRAHERRLLGDHRRDAVLALMRRGFELPKAWLAMIERAVRAAARITP